MTILGSYKFQCYNAKLAQKGEHQSKTPEVMSSILTGGNMLLLDFLFSCRKASDTIMGLFPTYFIRSYAKMPTMRTLCISKKLRTKMSFSGI